MMKYKVLLIESEEGFAASCPALAGCWSQGRTREEAMENIREAIRVVLLTDQRERPFALLGADAAGAGREPARRRRFVHEAVQEIAALRVRRQRHSNQRRGQHEPHSAMLPMRPDW